MMDSKRTAKKRGQAMFYSAYELRSVARMLRNAVRQGAVAECYLSNDDFDGGIQYVGQF
jgi:hypothetical protein